MQKKIQGTLLFVLAFVGLLFASYGIEQKILFDLDDPLKKLYIISGWASLSCLILGVFWGKMLGLCALLFACIHVAIFVYFDFYFDWMLMLKELVQKYYLYFGVLAFSIMIILGFFSLYRWFLILRYLVLLSLATACIHTIMTQKIITPIYMMLLAICILSIGYKLFKRF